MAIPPAPSTSYRLPFIPARLPPLFLLLSSPAPSAIFCSTSSPSSAFYLPLRLSSFCSTPRCRPQRSLSDYDVVEQEQEEEVEEVEEDGSALLPWQESPEQDSSPPPSSAPSSEVGVFELEELPEQWRRAKIAWLCKELPSYKHSTFTRILNAQRKWIRQPDATYIALHCLRIRDNSAAFKVYNWMVQQHWYQFDLGFTTKLADYLGKDRKIAKCREVFDAIVKQGCVPGEYTFHVLIVAYLSAPLVEGSLDEACTIYNQMVQSAGHTPHLSLHNALFRALVSKTGGTSKHYLKQAEFIYHNLLTSNMEIRKEIYAGLIWLHSYQDVIDKERIIALREEMKQAGFDEGRDVLVSIMRAFAKLGDTDQTEKAWFNLLSLAAHSIPAQAFVCRMDLHANAGEHMKALDVFREMKQRDVSPNVAAYQKIIRIMTSSRNVEAAELLMDEFMETGMKHLTPAFVDMMCMYLDLGMHAKMESIFLKCIARYRPNRIVYTFYLESLVQVGNIEKAEKIFSEMHENATIGTNAKSCNIILTGYLVAEEYTKAQNIYDLMRQKKYDVLPESLEKLQNGLILNRKVVRKTLSMKLNQEQREILTGLLLGGTRIESDERRRNHVISFIFQEGYDVHSALKVHIHERFYEWLTTSDQSVDDGSDFPSRFSTIAHSYFGFFADQFCPGGRPSVPKLVHRWLSPRVLAYWFMFAGAKLSSGDILLRLKGGNGEGIERIVNSFRSKSLACRVKRKVGTYWIGFQGGNALSFWQLIEPYLLDNFKAGSLVQMGNLEEHEQCSDSRTEAASSASINVVHGRCYDGSATEFSSRNHDSISDVKENLTVVLTG